MNGIFAFKGPDNIFLLFLSLNVFFSLGSAKFSASFGLYFFNFVITKSLVLRLQVFTRNLPPVLKLFNSLI